MIPIIVRVWCESGTGWLPTHVPVTPQTTGRDVLECCREPGDEPCVLFSVHPIHGVNVLRDTELPLEVAATLGPEVQFVLKYVGDVMHYERRSKPFGVNATISVDNKWRPGQTLRSKGRAVKHL